MIVGVGIDVVGVARFAETLERTPGLADRLFTISERQRAIASQAARFAAKEALAKALGAPGGLHWHDAEVVSTDDGRPWLQVSGTVAKRCAELNVETIHLSISHDAGIASAVVILESAGTDRADAATPPEWPGSIL
ncbi:MAG TPA: holo-ACP synthase [Jiangellaceae bacterium]|nr:holo-ACP synthase [Jiangellaceae bacterium]